MQYIIKPSQTAHFYQGINVIAQDGSLSDRAARILNYAISLPDNWRIIPRQLMKHFGWGRDVTYKALKELRKRNYAVLVRCRRAATWYIFNTPQSPETLATFTASNQPEALVSVACKNPDFKNSTNSDALQNTKVLQNTEITTTPPLSVQVTDTSLAIEKTDVVVQGSINEKEPHQTKTQTTNASTRLGHGETIGGIDPNRDDCQNDHGGIGSVPGIDTKHQKVARQALERLSAEQAGAVLAVFTLQCSKSNISNRVGYLVRLVQSALDGSFSPVTGSQAPSTMTLDERLRRECQRQQEQQRRGAMTSEQHARWLAENFGAKPVDAGKSGSRGVGLRSMLGWS